MAKSDAQVEALPEDKVLRARVVALSDDEVASLESGSSGVKSTSVVNDGVAVVREMDSRPSGGRWIEDVPVAVESGAEGGAFAGSYERSTSLERVESDEDVTFGGELSVVLWEAHVPHISADVKPKYSVTVSLERSKAGEASIELIVLQARAKLSIAATEELKLSDQTICQRRVLRVPARISKEGYGYEGSSTPDSFVYSVVSMSDEQIREESELISDCPCYGTTVPEGVKFSAKDVPRGGGEATWTVSSTSELSVGADLSLISVGRDLDKFLFKFSAEAKGAFKLETEYTLPAGYQYFSSNNADNRFMVAIPLKN